MKALVRRHFEDFINYKNAAANQENMTADLPFFATPALAYGHQKMQ